MDIDKFFGMKKNPLDFFGITKKKTTSVKKAAKKTLKNRKKQGKRKPIVKQKLITQRIYKPQKVRTQGIFNPLKISAISFTTSRPLQKYRQNIALPKDREDKYLRWYRQFLKVKKEVEKNGYIIKDFGIKSIGLVSDSEDDFKNNLVEHGRFFGNAIPVDIYADIPDNTVVGKQLKEKGLNPSDWWIRYDYNMNTNGKENVDVEILHNGARSYQDSDYDGYIAYEGDFKSIDLKIQNFDDRY